MDLLKYIWRYAFWTINRFFVILIIRPKFNVQKSDDSDSLPKPPFIIVANHGTFFDPWIIGSYCKYPMSIMMNDFGFKASPFVRWYQKSAGAFGKKKGVSDFKALREGLRELKRGYPLLIFPEGQVTWDGETQPLFHGVEKILKHLSLPVVIINIKGSFLCKPWWAKTYRKGRVIFSIKTIYENEINELNEIEILNILEKYLYNNDIKNLISSNIEIKGKDFAEGLQYFFWICKNCKTHDSLTVNGNLLHCSKCDACWMLNGEGRLDKIEGVDAGDLFDLAKWHRDEVKKQINDAKNQKADIILAQDENTEYCNIERNGKVNVIKTGILVLNLEYLTLLAKSSNSVLLRIPVSDIKNAVFQKKEFLECNTENHAYFFRFCNGCTMKWVYYIRYLNHYEIYEDRKYI